MNRNGWIDEPGGLSSYFFLVLEFVVECLYSGMVCAGIFQSILLLELGIVAGLFLR